MKKRSPQEGQIAIATAVFLFLISTTVVLGLAVPVYKEVKNSNDFVGTRQSYYLSEALNEDLSYRVKSAKTATVGTVYSLVLNNYTATGTITNLVGAKEVVTTGNRLTALRRVRTVLAENPSGVAFNYGVQVGRGGFVLNGGSQVNGNVYSNGNIIATNGVNITGSAVAADDASSTPDQSNTTPSTPASGINFGNAAASADFAQSFRLTNPGLISFVRFNMKKVSTPANATVKIVADVSGNPGTSIIAQGTLDSSNVGTSYGWVEVMMTTNPSLTAGTTYWLVIDATSNASKYYTIGSNADSSYTLGTAKTGVLSGSWTAQSLDGYFSVYLGGALSTLGSGTYVGSVNVGTGIIGDAWAHIVSGAQVAGSLFCQSGTDNNKVCDTSRADPAPQAYPVSDTSIQSWKDEALAGGVTSTDVTVGSTGATLGPRKIVGNLLVNGGGTLTLSGNLWVTGTLTVTGGGKVKLDPSYGSKSGVLVTDGRISLSGGGQLTGSGTAGSYLMILTTSDCPTGAGCSGVSAMTVSGGAGAVILNAQNGQMDLAGGVNLKEATAYKITATGGTTITYESGIANVNFSSGPSGGYNISSWQEVQ